MRLPVPSRYPRSCALPTIVLLLLTPITVLAQPDSASVKATFANPPSAFATAPLWVWNDLLTEKQVIDSLRDLHSQGVNQAFVHPRPGLMTPYLSDDWFRLWKAVLAEAERLDMRIWIYDENSYPSGFAGGFVPDAMPESRAQSLAFKVEAKPPAPAADILAVVRLSGDTSENVTAAFNAGTVLADGQYLVGRRVLAPTAAWHGGKTYVDLLRPGVTQKFLEITLDAYRREVGDQFGKRIPGSFTDEPHLMAIGNGIAWTDDLPDVFRKRWGYELMDQLPCLVRNVGEWKRVRHDLLAVLSDLFIERWARPYHDYCQKNNLQFTGHYWDHQWPRCESVPDNMAMYAWHQTPAIDCLMNQYAEGTHSQFGNARMVKELASVANQMGRSRTLCEAYGAGGWDLRFEDMKRIGDWLVVLGVNTIDEHLSYVTLRGARKHDHPQSFSYHEPWWNEYHTIARYLTRLSYATSLGKQVNRILVIEPTTTAWMYQFAGDAAQKNQLSQIGGQFFNAVMELERAQIEYDLGSEDIIGRNGSVATAAGKPQFVVGQAAYTTVVLPPITETLNSKTVRLLEQFMAAGGLVMCCGPAPALVDARPSDRLSNVAKLATWEQVDRLPLDRLKQLSADGFSIGRTAPAGNQPDGNLFHQRRQWQGGQIVLLVNTSIDHPTGGNVTAAAGGVEQWDPRTGKVSTHAFTREGQSVTVPFTLPACGSLLLNFTADARQPAAPVATPTATTIAPAGPIALRRLEPNVLTLDYVDLTVAGQSQTGIYYAIAANQVFNSVGMKGNPWSQAVQFKDELIRTKFPADSGFEVSYRFTVETAVPNDLAIVIERPDLYTITCNGQPVTAPKDAWWLDRAFGRLNIAAAAKVGENAVTLKASPMTIYHEIEPAYLLGDFTLRAADKGFVVAPPVALQVDKKGWNQQGHPFYATGVAYTQTFQIPAPSGRYAVSLPAWYGSVARVVVNGQTAESIFCQPWESDVTSLIKPGTNTIEVTVIGTLKNTLGPHHGNPPLGTAWPAGFRNAPRNGPPAGDKYSAVGYGLQEPFVLKAKAQ